MCCMLFVLDFVKDTWSLMVSLVRLFHCYSLLFQATLSLLMCLERTSQSLLILQIFKFLKGWGITIAWSCFAKNASSKEAYAAIQALNNQHTFPGVSYVGFSTWIIRYFYAIYEISWNFKCLELNTQEMLFFMYSLLDYNHY